MWGLVPGQGSSTRQVQIKGGNYKERKIKFANLKKKKKRNEEQGTPLESDPFGIPLIRA